MRIVFSLLLLSIAVSAQMKQDGSGFYTPVSRIIVVTTPDWASVDGTLQRYEKRDGKWVAIGEAFPVVVGKSGMGWDPVLLSTESSMAGGPIKHEGDGRSPAGMFEVGVAFGFSGKVPTDRDYIPLTAATECVDDVKSEHYAHVVDRDKVAKIDWNSSEKMREIEVYKLGMVVNYNLAKTVPGNGSCIFLHIWKGKGRGTAGCTAMDEGQLTELVKWIGSEKAVLVQLPTTEYEKVKIKWALP